MKLQKYLALIIRCPHYSGPTCRVKSQKCAPIGIEIGIGALNVFSWLFSYNFFSLFANTIKILLLLLTGSSARI